MYFFQQLLFFLSLLLVGHSTSHSKTELDAAGMLIYIKCIRNTRTIFFSIMVILLTTMLSIGSLSSGKFCEFLHYLNFSALVM